MKKNEDGQPIAVESKVFDNSYFGYVKIAVETAEVDKNGKKLLKRNNYVPIKGKTDYEIIPLGQDVKAYFEKNVLPYNPDAFYYCDKNGSIYDNDGHTLDEKHNRIGYEIPFIKIFYKFVEPQKSEDIFDEFETLSKRESELMKEILRK